MAAYDYAEIGLHVASPDARNPFTDVSVEGVLEKADGSRQWKVEGFCDSADGSVFRIRFMPAAAGDYKYRVTYRQGKFEKTSSGTFHAYDGHLRGPIRVDPQYPWSFIWEGTGKHYFYNGTTAYWLAGWKDDRIIDASIARLHRLKVNRIRVTPAGRECYSLYGEPVMAIDDSFSVRPSPWPPWMRTTAFIRGSITAGSMLPTGDVGRICCVLPGRTTSSSRWFWT
ncbi:MAG: DUF5060 domain-containing protein [Acidobacteriaceae bacterium]